MANTIRIKRSSTAGQVPATLPYGELAINVTDKILYYGNATNAPVALGGGSKHAIKALGHFTVAGGTLAAGYRDKIQVTRTRAGVYAVVVTGGAANDIILLSCADNYSIARTAGDASTSITIQTRNIGVIGHTVADAPDFSIAIVGA